MRSTLLLALLLCLTLLLGACGGGATPAATGTMGTVTINTDNRLMSGTSMTKEFVQLADAFGWGLDDFRWFTINAMKSAFIPFDQRLALIDGVIKPGYAALQA